MSETIARLRRRAVDVAVDGPGIATKEMRRAAFLNRDVPESARALVEKVAKNAWKVTDEDIANAKEAGLSEDEIFELVVCAALGQATRQIDAALGALDVATEAPKP
jgi:hypothetical protein